MSFTGYSFSATFKRVRGFIFVVYSKQFGWNYSGWKAAPGQHLCRVLGAGCTSVCAVWGSERETETTG